MTDLEAILKSAIQREHEIISRHTRRRNILEQHATRLRLGGSPAVVLAELDAAGESLEGATP